MIMSLTCLNWMLLVCSSRFLQRRTVSTSAFTLVRPCGRGSHTRAQVGSVSFLSIDSNTEKEGDSPAQLLKEIIRLRGPVDSGFGRGGKKLGFPTANLPSSLFTNALERVQTGVYFGWALIEDDDDTVRKDLRNTKHKAVVNVGYSPTFSGEENPEKIVEAHLMLNEDEIMSDFYNETMKLSLIGFLRREQKFPSFPDLVAAINNDVSNAKDALVVEPYSSLGSDSFFDGQEIWVGQGGGDSAASWEFQDMVAAVSAVSGE